MNSLILISLTISEFFDIHNVTITGIGYFILFAVFVLLSNHLTINKNMPEVLA